MEKLKTNFQTLFNLCNDGMSCNQNTSLTKDLNTNSFHKVFAPVASFNINECHDLSICLEDLRENTTLVSQRAQLLRSYSINFQKSLNQAEKLVVGVVVL